MAVGNGPAWWHQANLPQRLLNTVGHNWHLGFTAFGGPPVHFKIVSGLGALRKCLQLTLSSSTTSSSASYHGSRSKW
jgi:hypothetical protein